MTEKFRTIAIVDDGNRTRAAVFDSDATAVDILKWAHSFGQPGFFTGARVSLHWDEGQKDLLDAASQEALQNYLAIPEGE